MQPCCSQALASPAPQACWQARGIPGPRPQLHCCCHKLPGSCCYWQRLHLLEQHCPLTRSFTLLLWPPPLLLRVLRRAWHTPACAAPSARPGRIGCSTCGQHAAQGASVASSLVSGAHFMNKQAQAACHCGHPMKSPRPLAASPSDPVPLLLLLHLGPQRNALALESHAPFP